MKLILLTLTLVALAGAQNVPLAPCLYQIQIMNGFQNITQSPGVNATVVADLQNFLTTTGVNFKTLVGLLYSSYSSQPWFIGNATAALKTSSNIAAFKALFYPSTTTYSPCLLYEGLVGLLSQVETPANYLIWTQSIANIIAPYISTVWFSSISPALQNKINTNQIYCDSFEELSAYAGLSYSCALSNVQVSLTSLTTNFNFDSICTYQEQFNATVSTFPQPYQTNVSLLLRDFYFQFGAAVKLNYNSIIAANQPLLNKCNQAILTQLNAVVTSATLTYGVPINLCSFYDQVWAVLNNADTFTQSTMYNIFNQLISSVNMKNLWINLSASDASYMSGLGNCKSCCCGYKQLVSLTGLSAFINVGPCTPSC
jgi:hypothetical protein